METRIIKLDASNELQEIEIPKNRDSMYVVPKNDVPYLYIPIISYGEKEKVTIEIRGEHQLLGSQLSVGNIYRGCYQVGMSCFFVFENIMKNL